MLSKKELEQFQQALMKRETEDALKILDRRLTDLAEFEDGWSKPLLIGLLAGSSAVVKRLTEYGVSLDKKDEYTFRTSLLKTKKVGRKNEKNVYFKMGETELLVSYMDLREALVAYYFVDDKPRPKLKPELLIFLIQLGQEALLEDLVLYDDDKTITTGRCLERLISYWKKKMHLMDPLISKSILHGIGNPKNTDFDELILLHFMHIKEDSSPKTQWNLYSPHDFRSANGEHRAIAKIDGFQKAFDFFKTHDNLEGFSDSVEKVLGMNAFHAALLFNSPEVAKWCWAKSSHIPSVEARELIGEEFALNGYRSNLPMLMAAHLQCGDKNKGILWEGLFLKMLDEQPLALKEFWNICKTGSLIEFSIYKARKEDNLDVFERKHLEISLNTSLIRSIEAVVEAKPPTIKNERF